MNVIPFIRPATLNDLEVFINFAQKAGVGITSLPQNPKIIEQRVAASEETFSRLVVSPKHETYLFCLQWKGQVIGISGIVSRIGMSEPFFAYHRQIEKRKTACLKEERILTLLYFIRARKKPTEIGTLFLDKEFRKREFGRLLSLSRFLFMANFRFRFADTIIAELRGYNENGISPFWEAVGKHFFQTEFQEADFLRTAHPECIEELFPHHPLFVDLLDPKVQSVIGNVHAETLPAQRLLEKQGFKKSNYFDIFDAGPHFFAKLDEIKTISSSRIGILKELRSEIKSQSIFLVSNTKLDFRASFGPLIEEEKERVILHKELAHVLKVDIGDPIRYYTL